MHKGLVLVAEDELEIASLLEAYLQRDGFRTVRASTGEVALSHHRMLSPDIVLLDIGLPDLDGYEVMKRLRQTSDTPVIFLTALSDDLDRLVGLRLGADDYMVKPFNPQEVLARVAAVLRRSSPKRFSRILRHADIEVDLEAYTVVVHAGRAHEPVALTVTEFRILACLMRFPEKVFTRSAILDECLPDSDALDRTVDTHIANLRKKFEERGVSGLFQPVRGVGYRFASA